MFKIQNWNIDAEDNSISFHFECDVYGSFSEVIKLPEQADLSKFEGDQALHQMLNVAGVYLGVSYYKLTAADQIFFSQYLSDEAKASIEKLYVDGLGEFYIRNDLSYPPHIDFSYNEAPEIQERQFEEEIQKSIESVKATVAFGGGKDSHVSMTVLEKLGVNIDVVSITLAGSVQKTLQRLGHKPITFIEREIDPKLISLVKEGKGYNGHIPITAINSIILSIYSYLVGNDWIVFSNERGASVPTMFHGDYKINHQYSKSIEFEKLYRNTLQQICGDKVEYFSFLRPFSELWIAAYLAREAEVSKGCFSSCNRNFVFEGPNKLPEVKRWCGKCSKCVYTALIVAPHISKSEFLEIFGADILDDSDNIQVAKDLCGIGTQKPWECVGDFSDTASCLFDLSTQDEWRDSIVVKELRDQIVKKYSDNFLADRFLSEISSRTDHFLPDQLSDVLKPQAFEA